MVKMYMAKKKMVMSEICKMSMTEQFGFKNSELVQIENFMNDQNQKTAKDILDTLMEDKKLDVKQKIVIAYVIGNSARHTAMQEEVKKGMIVDMSSSVPPIGG